MDVSTIRFDSLQQLIVNILSPSGNTGWLTSLNQVPLRPMHLGTKWGPQVSSESKGIQCYRLIRLVSPLGLVGKSPGLEG